MRAIFALLALLPLCFSQTANNDAKCATMYNNWQTKMTQINNKMKTDKKQATTIMTTYMQSTEFQTLMASCTTYIQAQIMKQLTNNKNNASGRRKRETIISEENSSLRRSKRFIFGGNGMFGGNFGRQIDMMMERDRLRKCGEACAPAEGGEAAAAGTGMPTRPKPKPRSQYQKTLDMMQMWIHVMSKMPHKAPSVNIPAVAGNGMYGSSWRKKRDTSAAEAEQATSESSQPLSRKKRFAFFGSGNPMAAAASPNAGSTGGMGALMRMMMSGGGMGGMSPMGGMGGMGSMFGMGGGLGGGMGGMGGMMGNPLMAMMMGGEASDVPMNPMMDPMLNPNFVLSGQALDNKGRPVKFGGDFHKNKMEQAFHFQMTGRHLPPGREAPEFVKNMAEIWYMKRFMRPKPNPLQMMRQKMMPMLQKMMKNKAMNQALKAKQTSSPNNPAYSLSPQMIPQNTVGGKQIVSPTVAAIAAREAQKKTSGFVNQQQQKTQQQQQQLISQMQQFRQMQMQQLQQMQQPSAQNQARTPAQPAMTQGFLLNAPKTPMTQGVMLNAPNPAKTPTMGRKKRDTENAELSRQKRFIGGRALYINPGAEAEEQGRVTMRDLMMGTARDPKTGALMELGGEGMMNLFMKNMQYQVGGPGLGEDAQKRRRERQQGRNQVMRQRMMKRRQQQQRQQQALFNMHNMPAHELMRLRQSANSPPPGMAANPGMAAQTGMAAQAGMGAQQPSSSRGFYGDPFIRQPNSRGRRAADPRDSTGSAQQQMVTIG